MARSGADSRSATASQRGPKRCSAAPGYQNCGDGATPIVAMGHAIAMAAADRHGAPVVVSAALGCRRSAFGREVLAADGAVERVDQRLNLDELVAGALGLVAIEWCGEHL